MGEFISHTLVNFLESFTKQLITSFYEIDNNLFIHIHCYTLS